jgi:prepilin-type processing-associated H-X9-DG protein
LPEVLVSIGIVGVLIAILFPAAMTARKQARTLECLSNLRQIDALHAIYLSQNHRESFQYNQDKQLWLADLRKISPRIDGFRLCPEAIDPAMRDSGFEPIGAAQTSWGPGNGTIAANWLAANQASYGMNGWLYRRGPGLESFYDDNAKSFIKLQAVANASEVPAFADCVWIDGFPMPLNEPPTDLINPLYGGHGSGQMPRFCIDRHRRRINVAFIDGSARSVTLGELWELSWTADWKARRVSP